MEGKRGEVRKSEVGSPKSGVDGKLWVFDRGFSLQKACFNKKIEKGFESESCHFMAVCSPAFPAAVLKLSNKKNI